MANDYRSEKVTFTGALGADLAARLERPAGPTVATALFAHCFTCSKDSHAAARISRALAARGIAVLRFDFTGLGGSAGDFANTDFSSNVGDLVAAADFLRKTATAPRLLIGHSLGGAAVLRAARDIPEARIVATIAAPAEPGHLAHLLAPVRAEIEAQGEAEIALGGRTFRIRKQFLDDIAAQKLSDDIGKLRKALYVFHAPTDDVVGIENASRIFQAAKHPKSFVSLDGADHLLTRPEDAAYVADMIAAAAARHVGSDEAPKEPPASDAPEEAPDEGWVTVSETAPGPFAQEVRAGRHLLTADEPAAMGGHDTGPTPYGYLLAALGSCTAMTLRLYARRKKLPLDHVAVRLRHDRIHAADCADCEARDGKIELFEREIVVTGDLNADQRADLLRIADKCPVHRTLEAEAVIRTRLAS